MGLSLADQKLLHDFFSLRHVFLPSVQLSEDFVPVVYGRSHLASLHRMEVIIKCWGPPVGNQYFKSIMPDMHITLCPGCNKVSPHACTHTQIICCCCCCCCFQMFHADDYELQVLSKGHCPFCRRKPPN